MEKHTINEYFWILITVIIMLLLLVFASPFSMFVTDNLDWFTGEFVKGDGEQNFVTDLSENEYTVFYRLNGGSFENEPPDKIKYDTVFEVEHPIKYGYRFVGWEIRSMCSEVEHYYGNSVSDMTKTSSTYLTSTKTSHFKNLTSLNNGVVVFEAKWTDGYLITLDKNGGSGGTDYFYEKYNHGFYSDANCLPYNEITSITPPTRTGYTFNGYYSALTNGIKRIHKNGEIQFDDFTYTDDAILYARWIPNNYYLDLNWTLDGNNAVSVSGCTADIYINGILVADDVTDYYAVHPYGSKWEVKDIKIGGIYTYLSTSQSSGTIQADNSSNCRINLKTNDYYLDLNWTLDGNNAVSVSGCTADIYINGILVADDVTDYYAVHRYGFKWEVKDIKIDGKYIHLSTSQSTGTILADNSSECRIYIKTAHVHSWVWTRISNPTCTAKGKEQEKCSCGATRNSRDVAALGHLSTSLGRCTTNHASHKMYWAHSNGGAIHCFVCGTEDDDHHILTNPKPVYHVVCGRNGTCNYMDSRWCGYHNGYVGKTPFTCTK